MPPFELNLIRDIVVPLARRRVYLNVMLGYLFLCGLGLVIVFSQATRQFIFTSDQQKDIQRVEQEFKALHPQQDDIMDYASLLQRNLKSLGKTIGLLETDIGSRVDLARVLVGVTAPLPVEALLIDVRLAVDSRILSFEIAMPIQEGGAPLYNASELVAIWLEDQELMEQVISISAVASRRRLVAGDAYFVIKFSGELKPKAT